MVNPLLLFGRKRLVPGYTAYWDCTKVSGQTLPDQSGKGYTGTLGSTSGSDANDPTAGTTGLTFDGGDYVTVGSVGVIGTISFVFYSPGVNAGTSGYPLCNFITSSDTTHFAWIWFGVFSSGPDNEIVTLTTHDGVTQKYSYFAATSGGITAGWHVLTLSWNGTYYDIYLDGDKKTIIDEPIGAGHPAQVTATNLILGARQYNNSIVATALVDTSIIGAAIVYPTGLTSTQLSKNREYWKAKFTPLGVTLP